MSYSTQARDSMSPWLSARQLLRVYDTEVAKVDFSILQLETTCKPDLRARRRQSEGSRMGFLRVLVAPLPHQHGTPGAAPCIISASVLLVNARAAFCFCPVGLRYRPPPR